MTQAKLRTHTLGCKVNQYETEFVRQGLIDAGHYRDALPHETADVCIVNTCTVTHEGDAKSRQVIRRLARNNPGARLVVMGCYATRDPQRLASLPGVVEVVRDKRELPDLLGRFGVLEVPDGISRFGDRHRAYIKVQDGCLLRCSYCIIPQVRPQMTSRPVDSILNEARRLIDNGYRELVLTGIHLGHYGVDHNFQKPKPQWNRLSTLLRKLVDLPGEFRVRLSSIECTEVTRELLDVMADYGDRVCPHLHICLQSGADRILRRMKRRWGRQRLIDRCEMVKDRLPRPALTTDVIVGFPGETDDDFQQSCELVQQLEFSKVHIFPFSPRRGTPAAEMPEHVEPPVKSARVQQLAEVERQSRDKYLRRLLSETLEVLIETIGDDQSAFGTSCRYAPVRLARAKRLSFQTGQLMAVRAENVDSDGFLRGVVPTNGTV